MDLWSVFKQAVIIGTNPVAICLEFILVGVLLIWFSRTRTKKKPGPFWLKVKGRSGDVGTGGIVTGIVLLYLFSIETVSHGLSGLLEYRYPPLPEEEGRITLTRYPEFIVVLPGGDPTATDESAYGHLERRTQLRLARAIQIWRQYPRAVLLLSGVEAEVRPMRELALGMGVDPARIVTATGARDTADHPPLLERYLGGKPFLLVTSANHMPRSMVLFREHGLRPTPAPTDFHSDPFGPFHWKKLVPRTRNLLITDEALHEHIGIGWAFLSARLRNLREDPAPAPETRLAAPWIAPMGPGS